MVLLIECAPSVIGQAVPNVSLLGLRLRGPSNFFLGGGTPAGGTVSICKMHLCSSNTTAGGNASMCALGHINSKIQIHPNTNMRMGGSVT